MIIKRNIEVKTIIYTKSIIHFPRQNSSVSHSAKSAPSSVTELSNLAVLYNRDSVVTPGLHHLGHLLPLSGEGVELQDVIVVGETFVTA